MPFVNIQLVAGQGPAKKDEIARKVADAIHSTTGLPKESVWVVFEEVAAADWYVGERSVEAIRNSKT